MAVSAIFENETKYNTTRNTEKMKTSLNIWLNFLSNIRFFFHSSSCKSSKISFLSRRTSFSSACWCFCFKYYLNGQKYFIIIFSLFFRLEGPIENEHSEANFFRLISVFKAPMNFSKNFFKIFSKLISGKSPKTGKIFKYWCPRLTCIDIDP